MEDEEDEEDEENDKDKEEEFYLRRLDAGLFTLQLVDLTLAWIVSEDATVSFELTFFPCLFFNTKLILATSYTVFIGMIPRHSRHSK